MPQTIEQRYLEAKERYDELKTGRERSAGALAEVKKRMKKDFGFTDVKQLDRDIQEAQRELADAEKKFDKLDQELSSQLSERDD